MRREWLQYIKNLPICIDMTQNLTVSLTITEKQLLTSMPIPVYRVGSYRPTIWIRSGT
jgi:hypothetical protein